MKTITIIFILLAIILLTIINRAVYLRTKSEEIETEKSFSFIVWLNIGLIIAFLKPLLLLNTFTDYNFLNFGFSTQTFSKAFSLIAISSVDILICGALTFMTYFVILKRGLFKESNRDLLSIAAILFLIISVLCYFAFTDVFEAVIVLPTDLNIR